LNDPARRRRRRAERALIVVLRADAVLLMLAALAAVMPFSWMAATHRWLGLGELPAAVIVAYLARSLSVMYALHGAITLFVSFDVRRYWSFIRFLAWLGIGFGSVMFALDIAVGMPTFWIALEAPGIIAVRVAILWLQRRGLR
jgi:hypothetical protein